MLRAASEIKLDSVCAKQPRWVHPFLSTGTALATLLSVIRTRRLTLTLISIGVVSLTFFGECTRQSTTFGADKPRHYPTDSVENAAHRAGVVEGFYGPESVRYSPDQDIYFVSVMNGPGSKKDNNGYIVQIDAVEARFAESDPAA